MKLKELLDDIIDLSPEDAANALVVAICTVGNHGREAGDFIPKIVEDLQPADKMNFEEGLGWLEDE